MAAVHPAMVGAAEGPGLTSRPRSKQKKKRMFVGSIEAKLASPVAGFYCRLASTVAIASF
jgi:hypothetical protein